MTNPVRFASLLALAACSKPTSPPSSTEPGSGSAPGAGSGSAGSEGSARTLGPTGATPPPCPDEGPQLHGRVAALIGATPDDVSSATCVAGRFPEPGWAIGVRYWRRTPEDNQLMARELLVDAAGTVTWSEETDLPPSADDHGGPLARQAVDLDGDGTSELVETLGDSRRGYDTQLLIVRRRVAGAWHHALERQLAYDNSAADEPPIVSCEATWAITDTGGGKRAIVFEPRTRPAAKSPECILVKETWVPGGPDGRLVKLPAK